MPAAAPELPAAMRPERKIRCIVAATALALAVLAQAAHSAETGAAPSGAGAIRHAGLDQAGRSLILSFRTASPVALRSLRRFPRSADRRGRYLCMSLRRRGGRREKRICLGGARKVKHRVGLTRLGDDGGVIDRVTLAARIKRPRARKLVVTLFPAAAGLAPRRYAWRALGRLGRCRRSRCLGRFPARRNGIFRLRPVRAVGCTGGSAGLTRHGPRGRKLVALTFDDGPSAYTDDFLRVLRNKGVNGTFFEIGQEMPGRAGIMRRILAEGNEIGNHTMHHGFYPGYADLAATSARIRRLTHFRPCLFRPPGGGLNAAVISAAGQAGMKTVTWDVDPMDWATPGSGAIHSYIVGRARPGSIILMHDGGGNRGQTLAALPSVIDTLRARGYGFRTVTDLLGGRIRYRPYG